MRILLILSTNYLIDDVKLLYTDFAVYTSYSLFYWWDLFFNSRFMYLSSLLTTLHIPIDIQFSFLCNQTCYLDKHMRFLQITSTIKVICLMWILLISFEICFHRLSDKILINIDTKFLKDDYCYQDYRTSYFASMVSL